MALKPERSLLLVAWWLTLHALLIAAAMLIGWSWPARLAAVLVVAAHGAARCPRPPPGLILVSADAHCAIPDWNTGPVALGARTVVAPFWVRLDLGTGLKRLDILLCIDQVGSDDWARLRGLLDRARTVSDAAHGSRRPKEPI